MAGEQRHLHVAPVVDRATAPRHGLFHAAFERGEGESEFAGRGLVHRAAVQEDAQCLAQLRVVGGVGGQLSQDVCHPAADLVDAGTQQRRGHHVGVGGRGDLRTRKRWRSGAFPTSRQHRRPHPLGLTV